MQYNCTFTRQGFRIPKQAFKIRQVGVHNILSRSFKKIKILKLSSRCYVLQMFLLCVAGIFVMYCRCLGYLLLVFKLCAIRVYIMCCRCLGYWVLCVVDVFVKCYKSLYLKLSSRCYVLYAFICLLQYAKILR